MKSILTSAILIVLSLFYFIIANPVAADTIDVAQYANLKVGNGWTYQQSLYNGPWGVVVDSLTQKYGNNVILNQEYDSNGYKNDQWYFLSDLSLGMYWVGGINDYGQPTQEEFLNIPFVPLLQSSFVPGQAYYISFQDSRWPGNYIQGYLVYTYDTVSVPAGIFTNAIKVSGFPTTDTSGTPSLAWWYANDVGLIKRLQDDGNTWELTSVSGFSLPPIPEPETYAMMLAGLGLVGWMARRRG